MSDEMIAFSNVDVVAVTEKAVLLYRDCDEEETWFPKSQLDWVEPEEGLKRYANTTFYIPQWLAAKRGWKP